MNLHFKDTELFEKLEKATLFKAVVGSHMYGTNTEKSDLDYLSIYVPSISERNTFYQSHHQLQFKGDGVDHNYVNVFTFLKNLINADSTINLEVVCHESIKDSCLGFLYEIRDVFYNYKIVRGYTGFCNRDLKHLPKQPNDYEKNKKLCHVVRGLDFAKQVYDKKFSPIISEETKESFDIIMSIDNWEIRKKVTDSLKEEVDAYRKFISEKYDSADFHLPTFMKVENQKILDYEISKLIKTDNWKEKSQWHMDLDMFYDANENYEIRYEA